MAKQDKLDLYAVHKAEYLAPRTPALIEAGPARYLAIDGQGEPGGEVLTLRLGALYGVAFTIKMAHKFAGRDYRVCHLEGLWWGAGGELDFTGRPPESWNWTLLIEQLLRKRKPPETRQVRLEDLAEGRCVQMLHVGPYAQEPATVKLMREFAAGRGLALAGRHHEIYLSDPRRVPPERLRTIIRLPVAPGA